MKTSYGLEFDTVTEINPEWSGYDKTIAGCHLANARGGHRGIRNTGNR